MSGDGEQRRYALIHQIEKAVETSSNEGGTFGQTMDRLAEIICEAKGRSATSTAIGLISLAAEDHTYHLIKVIPEDFVACS